MTDQGPTPNESPLEHPTFGTSDRETHYLAVRWEAGATADTRTAVLDEVGVVPVGADESERSPLERPNQTEGLTWVEAADGHELDDDVVRRLSDHEAVAWVAPAFRSRGDDSRVYAVNPSRVYVRQSSLDRAGGTAGLGAAFSPDARRASRIPGYVAVAIEPADLPGLPGSSATDVVGALRSAGDPAPDIKFENIPFRSPTTTVTPTASATLATPFVPNDPMFGTQWGLQRIEIPSAWANARGSAQVTVAVIDEGVELTHPDLDMHPQSWNASTDAPDGSPTGNHGTACAGIIGARFDNGQGIAGVAAGVRVMAIATATWADIDIAEGLYFAADNGADVVSMSFGVYESWGVWDFDLIRDALQHCLDKGLVLVAASGNEDQPTSRFPGSDDRTVCVGGSNRSDERKRGGDSSSEPGWGACWGPDLDVVAPCLEIPTTDRLGADGYGPGDYYERFNGTSSATPHVAGLAALLRSANPRLSNADVRRIIESTCDKISPALYDYQNVASRPSGTWHEEVGYGRINAARAVLAAIADESAPGCSDCDGCGGACVEPVAPQCRAPKPVPWLPYDRAILFYEARQFGSENRLSIRVTYEHSLRLVGRQQGALLYTTSLLPGEDVTLYEFDRFRRVRSETQRVSVQTSFRQTVSSLSQNRRSSSASAYVDTLVGVRVSSDTSVSVGGGLAGFLGLPSGNTDVESEAETTVASGSAVSTVSEQFNQFATTASQSVESERSLVISSFEDAESVSTTSRVIRNLNRSYAVTYFIRRVNEVYESASRVLSVEWRSGATPWRSIRDLDGLDDGLRELLESQLKWAPREGERVGGTRQITLPTDGTLYEAELAHCSSAEPVRMAAEQIDLERLRLDARKAYLETELLELEVQRRRALAGSGAGVPLPLPQWSYESVTSAIGGAAT